MGHYHVQLQHHQWQQQILVLLRLLIIEINPPCSHQMFIMTKVASHTEPGVPSVAKWTDKNGNCCEQEVPRPTAISEYFEHSNVIHVLNQLRQKLLRLEKCWVTQDAF